MIHWPLPIKLMVWEALTIKMDKSMGNGWALTINIEKVIANEGH